MDFDPARLALASTLTLLGSSCGGAGAEDEGGETPGETRDEPSTSTESQTSTETETETETGEEGQPAPAGEFSLLTYNVAGLPQGVSSSNPEVNIPRISPLLNAYDLVLVQEDFYYHAELGAETTHPHRTTPWADVPDIADLGDGLNRFSNYPMADHDRTAWYACNGNIDCASDCLATKGWSFARTTLDPNTGLGPPVEIDIYNLHMEAGGCPMDFEIRLQSAHDLVEEIAARSPGRAVIVAGDFNLHETDPEDLEPLMILLETPGLTDACLAVDCGDLRIDKVFFRGSEALELEALSWDTPDEFVTPEGEDLSDHLPVGVRFAYTPR